ncbi:DUF397 domain-containing protein [Streptomyces sp. NPDC050617]|uniref:DUF397 domain-containing protein n=1 Tax=Streptomyces sp. NPDC050617 TaxID=3154628 RepID=UPI003422D78A
MGMSETRWQKSSHSTDAEGNCVELAAQAVGTVLLRESDAPGVTLTATPAHLRTLLQHVKAGALASPRP